MASFTIEVPGNWTIGASCIVRDASVGREVCIELERDDGDSRAIVHLYLSPPAIENFRRILAEANAIATKREA